MKAVSEVIAIILILMITISLAGLAYLFMSTTMADTTASASSSVSSTTSSMLTSFRIESMDIAKVYVRNTGQNPLTNLSVYVNDEPATYSLTPSSIAPGNVSTVTIYSFIPDGATIKITSPNGFSTSKVAEPCSKAVGCWKLDEISGSVAYDSSPNGNTGILVNGPTWTSGKFGNGLQFDGSNDYVELNNPSSLNVTGLLSISVWYSLYSMDSVSRKGIVGNWHWSANDQNRRGWLLSHLWGSDNRLIFVLELTNGTNITEITLYGPNITLNQFYHAVITFNPVDRVSRMYVNGTMVSYSTTPTGYNQIASSDQYTYKIGYNPTNNGYFNGTIDEVRIYNRAIY